MPLRNAPLKIIFKGSSDNRNFSYEAFTAFSFNPTYKAVQYFTKGIKEKNVMEPFYICV